MASLSDEEQQLIQHDREENPGACVLAWRPRTPSQAPLTTHVCVATNRLFLLNSSVAVVPLN